MWRSDVTAHIKEKSPYLTSSPSEPWTQLYTLDLYLLKMVKNLDKNSTVQQN